MKKALCLLLLCVTTLLITSMSVLAAYTYSLEIRITDTSGSARTNVIALVPVAGSGLVSAGNITSDATDTNMELSGVSSTYMMDTDKIPVVLNSLGANQTQTYDLRMGYSPVKTNFPIIVGEDGYITTSDNADLELGDTFELTIDGYINESLEMVNSTEDGILYKDTALQMGITYSSYEPSSVTATILSDDSLRWFSYNSFKFIFWLSGHKYLTHDGYGFRIIETNSTDNKIVNEGAYNYSSYWGLGIDACLINSTKVALVWLDSVTRDNVKIVIGTISGDEVTFGTPQTLKTWTYSAYYGSIQHVALIDTDKIAVTYNDADDTQELVVGTVSGTVITFGSSTDIGSTIDTPITKLATDKGIFCYNNGSSAKIAFRAFTVSGTTITLGAESLYTKFGQVYSITQLDTDKFAAVYLAAHPSPNVQKMEVMVGTTSGTTITQGTPVVLYTHPDWSGTFIFAYILATDSTHFYVLYMNMNTEPELVYYNYASVSGTTITLGTDTSYNNSSMGNAIFLRTNGRPLTLNTDDNKLVSIAYSETKYKTVLSIFPVGEYGWSTISLSVPIEQSGEYSVTFESDGADATLSMNGESETTQCVSVLNNSNNWFFNRDNAMLYINSISISVDGSPVLSYAPTGMLTGTVLVDEEGTQNGVITWGTNHNLSFLFGNLMPYEMAIPGASGGITVPTFAQELVNPQEELHSLPFWDIFSRASSDATSEYPNGGGINPEPNSGITMYGLYLLMGIAVVLAIATWIALLTGSKMILLISIIIMMAIFVQPLFSAWMVIALVIGGFSILYLARGGGL